MLGRGTGGRKGRAVAATAADEAGFSMVESIVAITIAAMVFSGSALLLGQALKTTMFARQNQQAAEVVTAEIEALRALDYGALAMVASDLTGDAAVTGSPPATDHDGSGPLTSEALALSATGAVNPHIRTVSLNATDYTVTRYVSEVDVKADATSPQSLAKRVTVRVSWTSGGTVRERLASTLVARTRRGLPLPQFTFGSEIIKTVVPGGAVVLPKTITNRGARDRWNLTHVVNPVLAGFTWYRDVDEDAVFDSTIDTALTDTDGDLTVDTGMLEVDETVSLLLVHPGLPDPAAATYDIDMTARSSAQPLATGGTRVVTDTISTTAAVGCSGCVYEVLRLHNVLPVCSSSCGTNALDPLPLDTTDPLATSLSDFDKDLDSVGNTGDALRNGRVVVESTGTSTQANLANMVRWRYQMPTRTVLSGTASVRLYAAPLSGGTDGVTLNVFLRRMKSNGTIDAELGGKSHVVTGADASDFVLQTIDLPLSEVTMGQNTYLEVKVVVMDDPANTDTVRVAYDTTLHPSTFLMPVKP